jgi:hypothetical protein
LATGGIEGAMRVAVAVDTASGGVVGASEAGIIAGSASLIEFVVIVGTDTAGHQLGAVH